MPRSLLLIATCAVLACGDGGSGPRPPDVVLITIDTIRADALGCYGREQARTPHIDRLAAGGARFKYAYAPRGVTLPSLTTILTGVSPLAHGVLGNANAMQTQQPTLGETLGDHGYATAAFLTNQCVNLVDRDDQASRGFDHRVCAKTESETYQYEWDERATELAVDWLRGVDDGPVLLWVHYMDPHGGHHPRMELYRGRLPADPLLEDQAEQLVRYEVDDITPPPEFLEVLWGLYDAEIENVDRLIGQVVDAARARRSDAEPIVILAGDHGEEFYQHNNFRGHGFSVFETVLRVPLVISGPGVPRGIVPKVFAELQDISPTVFELLGIRPSVRTEGESLLPRMELNLDKETGFGEAFGIYDQDIITVRRPRYRYVWNQKPGQQELIDAFRYRGRYDFFNAAELMFDVAADPSEQVNLLADGVGGLSEHAAHTRRALRKRIQEWIVHERHLSFQPQEIDDERLDAELRQLGYK